MNSRAAEDSEKNRARSPFVFSAISASLRLALLCVLGGCGCPEFHRAIEQYHRAMAMRSSGGVSAQRLLSRAREDSVVALRDCDLDPLERAMLASVRVRACLETGDDAAAADAVQAHAAVFETVDPDPRTPGDVAGTALLKGAWYRRAGDHDRAIAEYIAAEERTPPGHALAMLQLHKVEALGAKASAHASEGTPDARARAVRALEAALATCDAQKPGGPFEAEFKAQRAELTARLEPLRK